MNKENFLMNFSFIVKSEQEKSYKKTRRLQVCHLLQMHGREGE